MQQKVQSEPKLLMQLLQLGGGRLRAGQRPCCCFREGTAEGALPPHSHLSAFTTFICFPQSTESRPKRLKCKLKVGARRDECTEASGAGEKEKGFNCGNRMRALVAVLC